jgi:hypothetical protein
VCLIIDQNAELYPLIDQTDGYEIPNFPTNIRALNALSGKYPVVLLGLEALVRRCTNLLTVMELERILTCLCGPVTGDAESLRERLRHYRSGAEFRRHTAGFLGVTYRSCRSQMVGR